MSTSNELSLLPNIGIFQAKVPTNLRVKFLHRLLDAALEEISSSKAAAPSSCLPGVTGCCGAVVAAADWGVEAAEWRLLCDDLKRMLTLLPRYGAGFGAGISDAVLTGIGNSSASLDSDPLRLVLFCLETRAPDIDAAFHSRSSLISSHERRLVNFDWSVNLVLGSDKFATGGGDPRAFLHLRLDGGRGKNKKSSTTKNLTLDLSLAEIASLISSLKEAVAALDKTQAR